MLRRPSRFEAAEDEIPAGFRSRRASPPGAGIPYVTGLITKPIVVSVPETTPAITAGRHRGDGIEPVGNTNSRSPNARFVATKTHWPLTPTNFGRGSAPGWLTSAKTAYTPANEMYAIPKPTPRSTQPIRFRALRTIRNPRVA